MAGGLGRTGEAQEKGAAGANPDGEDPENASKAKKKSKVLFIQSYFYKLILNLI